MSNLIVALLVGLWCLGLWLAGAEPRQPPSPLARAIGALGVWMVGKRAIVLAIKVEIAIGVR